VHCNAQVRVRAASSRTELLHLHAKQHGVRCVGAALSQLVHESKLRLWSADRHQMLGAGLGPASPGTRPSIVFTLAALNVESLQHMERSVCQLFASAIFACRATRATTGLPTTSTAWNDTRLTPGWQQAWTTLSPRVQWRHFCLTLLR
jgi:hypothetical protein